MLPSPIEISRREVSQLQEKKNKVKTKNCTIPCICFRDIDINKGSTMFNHAVFFRLYLILNLHNAIQYKRSTSRMELVGIEATFLSSLNHPSYVS